jgi:DNA-binding LacI/PurR family transcriptional regulator
LQVPDDVSVAGFDDIAGAEQFDPPLTTVRQLSIEHGRRAAAMLFEMIHNSTPHERQDVALPTELVVRRSTAPPKGGSRL